MPKLKIVHLLASHKWTGPAEAVVTLCRDLVTGGHHVRFFCTPNPRRLLADQAVRHGVIPDEGLRLERKHPILIAADIRWLKNFLRRERPDILHLHLSADHWIGGLAARWAGTATRVVRTVHHPRSIDRRPFRAKLYGSMTDGFITLCERDCEKLRQGYQLDSKPVSVIHGAVDTSRFCIDAEARLGRAEFGLKMTTPVIGMVSRFQPHRRHETMIAVIDRLRKRLPLVRLLLVGRGEHQPVIEKMVKDLALERYVIFTGYRDRDLPQIYAAMDVAVQLASGSDGSCRATLEAMAVGRPVVGFPVAALPETIIDGATGYLVPEGDLDALTDRLEGLLTDRSRSQSLGEAARKRIESEFTEMARLERTVAFYHSLTGK